MTTQQAENTRNQAELTIDSHERAHLTLNGGQLTLTALDAALGLPISVRIADDVWQRVESLRRGRRPYRRRVKPAYGINTGFGHLCRKRIPPAEVVTLQENLIISHAVGVGEPTPPELVRWMMLFKLHALTHGYSGITRNTLECLRRMLEADLLPVVPTQGSLGASGDLAPLAHMVLPMLGKGEVTVQR